MTNLLRPPMPFPHNHTGGIVPTLWLLRNGTIFYTSLMRKSLALLIVALLARPVFSNSSQTFILAQVDEITSLDPAYPYDNASQNVIFNVYDTLLGFDRSSFIHLIPSIATQVPSRKNGGISANGRVYRFHIRKGIHFQDGEILTPEDVRYSLLRFMLMDRPGGPSSLLLKPILGIDSTQEKGVSLKSIFDSAQKAVRVEGQDVVITLKRPFAPFLSIMARWSYVLPKNWAAQHGDWDGTFASLLHFNRPSEDRSYLRNHMDGSGPFKLMLWNPISKYIILKRNEYYWRKPAALSQVIIRTIPEFSTQKLMLKAGDVDAVNVSPAFLSEVSNIPEVRIVSHLPRIATDPVFFFTFQISPTANRDIGSGRLGEDGIPPDFFSDLDVRLGMTYAFDAKTFVGDALKGEGTIAKSVVPPKLLPTRVKIPYRSYNLQKAVFHFKRAFHGQVWKKGFHFTLTYNTGSENRMAAALILKKNVEALNPKFHIDVRGLDWPSFLDKSEKHLMPIFVRGWYADYPDAYNFLNAFYASNGRYPLEQKYQDPQMDSLVKKLAESPNRLKRIEWEKKILTRASKNAPNIPVANPTAIYALRREVEGFYDNPIALGLDYYYIRKK